jgi:hypothetical protein
MGTAAPSSTARPGQAGLHALLQAAAAQASHSRHGGGVMRPINTMSQHQMMALQYLEL